jgi:hypothetical protein
VFDARDRSRGVKRSSAPLQVTFDPTPEIFATDAQGAFSFPLLSAARAYLDTNGFDEVRFVVSIWHPTGKTIDLDRAYVELRAAFDPEEDHWTKLAEIEPVVPPYNAGESFDGWIVLPVMGVTTAFLLFGSGFEPRTRLQARTSAFLVA